MAAPDSDPPAPTPPTPVETPRTLKIRVTGYLKALVASAWRRIMLWLSLAAIIGAGVINQVGSTIALSLFACAATEICVCSAWKVSQRLRRRRRRRR